MDEYNADRLNALAERLEALLSRGEAGDWDAAAGLSALTSVPPAEPAQTEPLPALRSALQQLTVTLDGEAVGRLVASSVDAELGAAALGRRFG